MEKTTKKALAFDFGASSGRAILGTLENGKITMEEVRRFSNDPVIVHGTMYWDTLRQFFEIKQAIVRAKDYGEFESIGIDAWGVDFGLLDEHGELLENAVHYRDGRTQGMIEKVFSRISKERLYEITGNEFMYFNTIFQMAALKEKRPWLLERADKFLFTPDLFNYFLTGEQKCEYTMATTSSMFDICKRAWSPEALGALGLPRSMFPELIESGTIVGEIKPEICEELTISPKKVIAVASHDTQSASVAVPTQEEDFIFISCGTWSLYGTELPEPVIGARSLQLSVTNEGSYGGKINFLKNITGLWMIQESRRQWMREGREYSFGELEELAKEAKPFQSYIDVNAPEFVPAGDMPGRIRKYCQKTGQPVPETIGEIVRCINQSLALRYRRVLEQIQFCLDKKYHRIHMIGGGIQSKMLCQMTACATNCQVVAGPVEATALGNLAVQFMALGAISDVKEARAIIARSEQMAVYQPEDAAAWEKAYEHFKKYVQI